MPDPTWALLDHSNKRSLVLGRGLFEKLPYTRSLNAMITQTLDEPHEALGADPVIWGTLLMVTCCNAWNFVRVGSTNVAPSIQPILPNLELIEKVSLGQKLPYPEVPYIKEDLVYYLSIRTTADFLNSLGVKLNRLPNSLTPYNPDSLLSLIGSYPPLWDD